MEHTQLEQVKNEKKVMAENLLFGGGVASEELAEMLQLKAIYGLTSQITEQCFSKCIGGELNRKMENDQRQCIVNCAVNYLTVKMLSAKKLLSSAQTFKSPEGESIKNPF